MDDRLNSEEGEIFEGRKLYIGHESALRGNVSVCPSVCPSVFVVDFYIFLNV